jgi:hypothetical protein
MARAECILGYTAKEMIGTSIMRLIPLDRQEEEHEILSGSVEANASTSSHFRCANYTSRGILDRRYRDRTFTCRPSLARRIVSKYHRAKESRKGSLGIIGVPARIIEHFELFARSRRSLFPCPSASHRYDLTMSIGQGAFSIRASAL